MVYLASYSLNGLFVQVDGPEVEAIFGGTPAGGPLEFEPSGALHDAIVARVRLYCQENLLPVPSPEQVVILTGMI